MQVIRQRYYMRDAPVYAWRPIEPYCVDEIPYYDLTLHRPGDDNRSDRYLNYTISGYAVPSGIMFRRSLADETIRETGIPNNTTIRPAFIDNDVVATTVPLNKLRVFHARFHRIKALLFNPSVDTPNLQELRLRGNNTELGDLDMRNCTRLSSLDISICYINSLKLPITNDSDTLNYFQWAYLGNFDVSDRREMPPVQVIDEVTKRAYYSRMPYSAAPSTAYKQLSTDTGNGHLTVNGIQMHRVLVQSRNWQVLHLSLETFNLSFNGEQNKRTFQFMTSNHDWNIVIDVPWITVSQSSGSWSNSVQMVLFTIAENTTNASRSAVVKFRKIKRYPRTTSKTWEDGTEFHHAAHVDVFQDTFIPFNPI